jgi:thioredoxin 1
VTLPTNLKHVGAAQELKDLVGSEAKVMVCCGRMGPMCVPVYAAMEELERSGSYDGVAFRDMAFDSPEAEAIRALPECRNFRGLPFTVYYRGGKVVKATSSIQSKAQVAAVLDEVF